jgi:hypothetical protein
VHHLQCTLNRFVKKDRSSTSLNDIRRRRDLRHGVILLAHRT